MKNTYRWIIPPLVGTLAVIFVWVITGYPGKPSQRIGGVVIGITFGFIIHTAIGLRFFFSIRIKVSIEYTIILFYICLR